MTHGGEREVLNMRERAMYLIAKMREEKQSDSGIIGGEKDA